MKALKSDLSVHMRSSNLERGLISPVTGLPGEHTVDAGTYFGPVFQRLQSACALFPVLEVTTYNSPHSFYSYRRTNDFRLRF